MSIQMAKKNSRALPYEIVKFRPEFREQVVDLLGHIVRLDRAGISVYFEWRYERDPYLAEPLIYLALHKGRVVGMRGMHGARWEVGTPAQTPAFLVAGDLVVAPEYRRRGIFRKIMETAGRDLAGTGCDYLINLSSVPITFFGGVSMGWRSPGAYGTLRWESKRGALARRLRSGAAKVPLVRRHTGQRLFPLLPPLGNPFQTFDAIQRRDAATLGGQPAEGPISFARVPRPADMANLVARVGTDGRLRLVRDQTFLTWRFQDPRWAFRFIYWAEEQNRLDGYLVLQARPDQGRAEARIADWEASTAQVAQDLLHAALGRGLDTLFAWSATLATEKTSLLRDAGFEPMDDTRGVVGYWDGPSIRATDDSEPVSEWWTGGRNLLDLSDWDLRMIFVE